jgi:hypothetical protein
MPTLSLEQIEKVELLTGHSTFVELVRRQLESEISSPVLARVEVILSRLDEIDLMLVEAIGTSFVTEAAGSKLDYGKHQQDVKSEGTRLLKELCHYLNIELRFNKYRPNSSQKINYTSQIPW